MHLRVILRYRGLVDDPRGRVRHVISGRTTTFRAGRGGSPKAARTIGFNHVVPLFAAVSEVAILAALVQKSGLDQLGDSVFEATRRAVASA